MNEALALEEIGRIVDRVIENPEKAAKLKAALHSSGLPRLNEFGKVRARPVYDDLYDDIWDNVPI